MLTFKPVAQRDMSRLRRYYKDCDYQLCEYSALVKLMWRGHLHPQYAEAAGCLIVKNCIDGKYCFDYPVPGPDGDEDAALCAIEEHCMEQGIALELSVVPREKAGKLLMRYPHFHLDNPRSWRDYLYEANDLRDFPGRHYSGQRNHVNKFRKLYPEARFRALGKDDLPLIERFWQDYTAVFEKTSKSAKNELALAKTMLRLTRASWLFVGGMEYEGRLISLAMAERCGAVAGDMVFILCGKKFKTLTQLCALRLEVAQQLGLRDPQKFAPLWVVDFPLFEWDDETQRYYAVHHPFTAPKLEDVQYLDSDPGRVRANAYDFVCNGTEIGGGSIRIHDSKLQEKMFELLGFTPEEAQKRFGFLMNAFKYGAPPHGGLAFGFDRLCSLFGGSESIRDYIAFPKNNAGRDMMLDAPGYIDQSQLDELYLELRKPEE